MLWGGASGGLDLRQLDDGGAQLTGRFPYGIEAELGAGRIEVIAPRAFASQIASEDDIFLLAGHDFDKPLASRKAGSLRLDDGEDALTFEARIADDTTWARDFLAAHRAGLIKGLSPGFRVPQNGERITKVGRTIRRTVFAAELVEISTVARPAYDQAQVEARFWKPRSADLNQTILSYHATYGRWR
ncbi:MAG: HK97 family phage prohead protease [Pseudomonadota bacterium]